MPVIGFHNSHEQVHPAELLTAVQHAEEVGFTAAMSSDHFSPWSARQGQSGFGWSFLGAALATTSLPFGAVNAPRLFAFSSDTSNSSRRSINSVSGLLSIVGGASFEATASGKTKPSMGVFALAGKAATFAACLTRL